MSRGSALCAKLHEKIVSQFKDNVSQRKIPKNFGLLPSTVHNIVKRFRESGEISVRKGQGWKPLLNARDHRAHCIVWETVMLPWWTYGSTLENHYPSTQSTTASKNATWNFIMQRGRHLLILHRNAAKFSGPEVIWDGSKDSVNMFSGQTTFHLVFGKNGCSKDEKDHRP